MDFYIVVVQTTTVTGDEPADLYGPACEKITAERVAAQYNTAIGEMDPPPPLKTKAYVRLLTPLRHLDTIINQPTNQVSIAEQEAPE